MARLPSMTHSLIPVAPTTYQAYIRPLSPLSHYFHDLISVPLLSILLPLAVILIFHIKHVRHTMPSTLNVHNSRRRSLMMNNGARGRPSQKPNLRRRSRRRLFIHDLRFRSWDKNGSMLLLLLRLLLNDDTLWLLRLRLLNTDILLLLRRRRLSPRSLSRHRRTMGDAVSEDAICSPAQPFCLGVFEWQGVEVFFYFVVDGYEGGEGACFDEGCWPGVVGVGVHVEVSHGGYGQLVLLVG